MSLAPKRDIHPALALMETPERHKESGDGEYAPKRVLCATETVVTDNEDDNEEPLNVPSEASRDVSPRRPGDPLDQSLEFYKTILEEGKDFAFTLSTDTKSHLPVIVSQCELAYHPPFGTKGVATPDYIST